ncbi:hypothetical protein [Photobacterium damselae]|uniref:hypothetical protein n=1 Tax=Photobacterium damselae TaxID=38293 RepID=UPI004068624D
MYHKRTLLLSICILSTIPQISFANKNIYTLTESSQGISDLFESQGDKPIEGQDKLKSFELKNIITNEGNTEYRFIPIKIQKPMYQWVEAEGSYSLNSADAKKVCLELNKFGAEWRLPTADEMKSAFSYDNDLKAMLEALPGDDIVKGYLDVGEWYYIRSNHTGGAIDKNMGDGQSRPTVCHLNV